MGNASDRLGSIGGIKGKVTVELFNEKTGELEFYVEKDNMVFNTFSKYTQLELYGRLLGGVLENTISTGYLYDSLYAQRQFTSLFLTPNSADVSEDESKCLNIADVIGFASLNSAYSGTDLLKGSVNLVESMVMPDDSKVRIVVDFPTDKANGTFQSVMLGQGAPDGYNEDLISVSGFMPNLKKDKDISWPQQSYGSVFFMDEDIFHAISYTGNLVNNIIVTDINAPTLTLCTLKKANDTSFYAYAVIGMSDTHLYVAENTDNIYKFSLPITSVSLAVAGPWIPPTGLAESTTTLVVSDTLAYCKPSATAIDAVTGEPFNRCFYKYNPSTGVILDRIRIPEIVHKVLSANNPNPGYLYAGLKIIGIDQETGELLCKVNNTSVQLFARIHFDNETYSITRVNSINSSMNTVFGMIDNEINVLSINYQNNYSTMFNSKYCFFKVIDFGVIYTRVLLPAPVTKINTQTLKITYDLIFEDGIL